MSYQVFARKYRPQTFDDVLGQDHVIKTLRNAIEQNRLAHAYLFVGPRGTGKTSTARIFAKALNCTGGPKVDFDPNEDICREIAEGQSLDVREIDGASNRGIDHIRDLRDNVRFAPVKGTFRIVYIDEVHMLTKESFNALLKTLEEPPPHVKFIFATTEPHKILPTILSRCQRFDLRPIPVDIIAGHLLHICELEQVQLTREAAFAIAKAADGGMRDAESMLDQLVAFCGNSIDESQVLQIFGITSRETVASALKFILGKNLPDLLKLVQVQAEAGRDMGQFLSEIISTVREVLVSKVDPSAVIVSIPPSLQKSIGTLIASTKTDKILRLVEVLSETEDKMRWSAQKRLHLEMGLIKAVHALAEASISDIIRVIAGRPISLESVEVTTPPSFQNTPITSEPSPVIDPQHTENENIAATLPVQTESSLYDDTPTAQATELPQAMQITSSPDRSLAEEQGQRNQEEEPTETLIQEMPALKVNEGVSIPSATLDWKKAWDEMMKRLAKVAPLRVEFIQFAVPLSYENNQYVIGVHPEDTQAHNNLTQAELKSQIEGILHDLLGESVNLRVMVSADIPAPVLPAIQPEPAPLPVQASVSQQKKKEEKKPITSQSPPIEEPNKVEEDDYYHDPFIEKALSIFKAKIIS